MRFAYILVLSAAVAHLCNGGQATFISNKLTSLIRFNRKGERVSSDLGDYFPFACHGLLKDRSCHTELPTFDDIQGGGDSSSFISYIDGVAMYGVINIAAFLLLLVGTMFWIFGLFCCKCLELCGWKRKSKSYFKPVTRQYLSIFAVTLFAVVMIVLIIVGYAIGSKKAFDFISDVADAPSGAASILHAEVTPLANLMVSSVGSVLVPLLTSLNDTIVSSVNFDKVNSDLKHLNQSFYDIPFIPAVRDILNTVSGTASEAKTGIASIVGDVVEITAVRNGVKQKATILMRDVIDVGDCTANVSTSLDAITSILNNVSVINSKLFDASSGVVTSVISDFSTISRSTYGVGSFPDASNFTAAATGDSKSCQRLITGKYNSQNADELNAFVDDLQSIYFSVSGLPNYNLTAFNLLYINQTIDSFVRADGIMFEMLASIDQLQTKLKYLPSFDKFEVDVIALYNATTELSLDEITSHVYMIVDLVDEIPSIIDSLLGLVRSLPPIITDVVPVLYDLSVSRPANFNRSVAELPLDTGKMFHSLNKTLYDNLGVIDTIQGALESSKESIIDVNISSYLDIIDSAKQAYDDSISAFNYTGLLGNLRSMASRLPDTNFTSYLLEIESTRATFAECFIPASAVDALLALQSGRQSLEKALQRAVSPLGYTGSSWNDAAVRDGDYLLLSQGVCSSDSTVYCSTDADCSSGTCVSQGTYRCSSNAVSSQSVVACTSDSACSALGGDSYCLADSSRAATLQGWLAVFGTDILPASSHTAAVLSKLVASEYDTSGLVDEISNIQNDLSVVDTTSYIQKINETLDALMSYSMDSINSTLQSAQQGINRINFDKFNSTLDTVESKRKMILNSVNKYFSFVDNIVDFVFDPQLLRKSLSLLSFSELTSYHQVNSPSQTSEHIATVLNNAYQDFRGIFVPISDDVKAPPSANFSKIFNRIGTFFDHTGVDPASEGSLYYLMSQSDATKKQMVSASDSSADSVTTDRDGHSYSDGKRCLTKSCFQRTQESMSSDSSVLGIGLSLQTLLGLIWLPLGIVVLVSLWSVMCAFFYKSTKCNSFPSTCLLILIIVEVPWYFLGTAFILPMGIVVSDGCSSGTNIINNYANALGDSLCHKFGGNGTYVDCELSFQGIDVAVNLEGIIAGLMGECAGGDAFHGLLNELAVRVESYAINKTDAFVYSDKRKNIRMPIKDIIASTGHNFGSVVRDFLESNGDIVNCPAVANVIRGVKSPACESFAQSLGWLSSMLYLAAWTMCCLGIPSGCAAQHHCKWTRIENKKLTASLVEPNENSLGDVDQDNDVEGGVRSHFANPSYRIFPMEEEEEHQLADPVDDTTTSGVQLSEAEKNGDSSVAQDAGGSYQFIGDSTQNKNRNANENNDDDDEQGILL